MAKFPRGGFSWSATRHGMFESCERQYFFNYYLGSGKALDAEPDRAREAAFLKALTSIPMWVGSRIHDAIETLLREAHHGGPADPELVGGLMLNTMRRQFKESLDNLSRSSGDVRNNLRFFEHEYGIAVADETWKERVSEAREMLRAFSRMPYLDQVRGLSDRNLLGLERLENWSAAGVPVWVKIDFAYRDSDDAIHILDWKTGKHERGENPLQMVGYALYAREAWDARLDQLRVREVYLRNDPAEKFCELDEEVLQDGEETILGSIAAMQERLADRERNLAHESVFSFTDDQAQCRSCFFQRICPRPTQQ